MSLAAWLLTLWAALLAAGTLASAIRSPYWWMRVWDFPRNLVCWLCLATLIASPLLLTGWPLLIVALAMTAAIAFQCLRILPYTPLVKPEVGLVDVEAAHRADHCFTALSFNVLQTNRRYADTLALIHEHKPDIVLLLETDQGWVDAMASIHDDYPHRHLHPLDNLYGLAFYSRLTVDEAEINYLVEEGIPSIFARLRTRGGRAFHYVGLHPRPPQYGKDTEERDAEIAIAARHAAEKTLPVLAMGDFNDVAWSRTSHMFKRIGGYLDPRIGRGFFATFPAALPVCRWPLDHLFITPEFTVGSVAVLRNVGSDHLPVIAEVCLKPAEAERLNETPDEARAQDHQDAEEMIALAEDKIAAQQAEG